MNQSGAGTQSSEMDSARGQGGAARVAWCGRLAGPLCGLLAYLLLPDAESGLTPEARATAAVGILMGIWWMTEALPLPATSLLPIVLFPLCGVVPIEAAAAPYASKYIFLFMGGFIIALAIEKWNLHLRLALLTVLAVGTQPRRLVGGFMLATAGLSMWISNTATTVMMLPIGLSVIGLLRKQLPHEPAETGRLPAGQALAVCLMLGIAYGASVGGVATLVGTPPNVFLSGFLHARGVEVGFGQWMWLGLPFSAIFLFIVWLVLTRWAFPIKVRELPGARTLIRDQLRGLGPMTRPQWTVLAVFALTATCWVCRKPLAEWDMLTRWVPAVARLDDSLIALGGALLLFILPVNARRGQFAMDWETACKLPWGVLLLFGGGLSLARAVTQTGLDTWIGQLLKVEGLPAVALVVLVTAVVIFLTEFTSNLATATAMLPLLGGVAAALERDLLLLAVPAALAASCAFMMPVATPPNAIVFGSGQVTMRQMMRAGLLLNLIGVALITLLVYLLGPWVFGVQF